jgi:divalent metal cation (Fe/Co/Zn/Cd) transporter
MLAEAIHSLADCSSQIFLLTGIREAKKPANEMHRMRYGGAGYFGAMMVALLLFFLGGAFSVCEGKSDAINVVEESIQARRPQAK